MQVLIVIDCILGVALLASVVQVSTIRPTGHCEADYPTEAWGIITTPILVPVLGVFLVLTAIGLGITSGLPLLTNVFRN